MIKADFHVHTNFCDGKNTPEEMVQAAISLGMTSLGFSVHSYTEFDQSYCIKKEKVAAYIEEINRLKEKYSSKIRILCGIERDLYAETPEGCFDYTIGSLHYVKKNGVYYTVDESADRLRKAIDEAWQGSAVDFAKDYFAEASRLGETSPDIIGHLDLITKFDEIEPIFDITNPAYVAAAKKAVDALLPLGVPFEINTGAISRGYRKTPYPAPFLLAYILEKGGKVILSGDVHAASGLLCHFEEAEALARSLGAEAFETL
ncbi:MAG: histidinol-phosphatase HisJ family protein [Clostridia bacterium]|nr:histidinol-phosphatase HisJ family protein [Clostridia bacterium]